MDMELIKILNKVQILTTSKEYIYNKMECINSKPVLQAGNENLTEYRVLLQLHCRTSNPNKIIEKIEDYASKRKPFDWIYNGKYMGEYVIDNVEKNIEKQIKDLIIYAELTVNLLENPQEQEFQEQIIEEPDLTDFVQFDEASNVLKEFDTNINTVIFENIKTNIVNGISLENLSSAAQDFLNTLSDKVISDISDGKITDIYNTVSDYQNTLENSLVLSSSEVENVKNLINTIPELMLETGIRSG
ncbi:MAG: hypothetical protein ACI37T_05990 [Candidatus Gastranaerophilaceae bacterium]